MASTMLLSNESVTHGSCGSRRKRHSGIHTATLDSMGRFPAPPPFHFETNVEGTDWFDPLLHPHGPFPPTVGFIVPGGFESYARLLHPACRVFGQSAEQSVPLRWSEIAAAHDKTMHPEVELQALIDNQDPFDYEHWKSISTGGGEWLPPYEWLEETEALALISELRQFTAAPDDAWFMLWDGYGDLGPAIDGLPRGAIHRVRAPPNVPAELVGRTWAYRHYLVFRGPLDAISTWFDWRMEGPNYLWPDDRAWIVATEIDGFSTYVGAPKEGIDSILASPLLEALPSALTHRFDGLGDPINGASR
jgi:hypothetical protein